MSAKLYAKIFVYRLIDEPEIFHAYFSLNFVPVSEVTAVFLDQFGSRLLTIRPIYMVKI